MSVTMPTSPIPAADQSPDQVRQLVYNAEQFSAIRTQLNALTEQVREFNAVQRDVTALQIRQDQIKSDQTTMRELIAEIRAAAEKADDRHQHTIEELRKEIDAVNMRVAVISSGIALVVALIQLSPIVVGLLR